MHPISFRWIKKAQSSLFVSTFTPVRTIRSIVLCEFFLKNNKKQHTANFSLAKKRRKERKVFLVNKKEFTLR